MSALTTAATPGVVNQLIASFGYQSSSDNPGAGDRTVTETFNDGGNTGSGGALSDSVTQTVHVTPVNDAPALDLDADNSSGRTGADFTAFYRAQGPAVAIADSDASIIDPDNATLASATVTLTNKQANDLLAANGALPGNIVASAYNPATGVLSLASAGATATLAQWQSALHQIVFSNSGANPSVTARDITVTVNDGAADSNVAHATVTLDQPPTLVAGNAAGYTQGGAPASARPRAQPQRPRQRHARFGQRQDHRRLCQRRHARLHRPERHRQLLQPGHRGPHLRRGQRRRLSRPRSPW